MFKARCWAELAAAGVAAAVSRRKAHCSRSLVRGVVDQRDDAQCLKLRSSRTSMTSACMPCSGTTRVPACDLCQNHKKRSLPRPFCLYRCAWAELSSARRARARRRRHDAGNDAPDGRRPRPASNSHAHQSPAERVAARCAAPQLYARHGGYHPSHGQAGQLPVPQQPHYRCAAALKAALGGARAWLRPSLQCEASA